MKLYIFRTVPLSIIRSYSLYTQQWYMSYIQLSSSSSRIRMDLQVCRQLSSSSRIRMELQVHPDPAAARKLHDI
jgi:hypothetical protein